MAKVGDVRLGGLVEKQLDEILKTFSLLTRRYANLCNLKDVFERLQPSIREFWSMGEDENCPVAIWLTTFQGLLRSFSKLVQAAAKESGNIRRDYLIPKQSLKVYKKFGALLEEAATAEWASGLSIQSVLTKRDAKVLESMKARDEKIHQLLFKLSNFSNPGSEADLRWTVCQLASEGFFSETADPFYFPAAEVENLPPDMPESLYLEPEVPDMALRSLKPEVTFGGEKVASKLINHLVDERCKMWVGLWGTGGIGKTFTASTVYNDPRIRKHFSGGRYWVTISKDQPGPNHLFKQLLTKIDPGMSISQLPDDLGLAKSYLRSFLDREKVLLVLDDVWQDDVLGHLDVVSEHKNGVILVTTRDRGILRGVMSADRVFEVPPLSEEDSWKLFSWHAFSSCGRAASPEVVDRVAKLTAEECGGLPLVLEVVGSAMALAGLVTDATGTRLTPRLWARASEHLKHADGATEYDRLLQKLQLSVMKLRDLDSRLRDCFFYFAAFPEDAEVPVEDLVRIWIAEGLVQDNVNSWFSGEVEGKVLLGILAAKSMIKVTQEGRCCKVHDVMRHLAQRNLTLYLNSGENIQASARHYLYAPGWKISNLSEDWVGSAAPPAASDWKFSKCLGKRNAPVVPYAARSLSLRDNDLEHFPEPVEFTAPSLQVLLLSNNMNLRSVSTSFCKNLPNLKVLDLSRTGIEEISGELLRRLDALVLLDCSWCKSLRKVPNNIGNLKSLKFLFLNDCQLLQNLPRVDQLNNLKTYAANAVQHTPKENNIYNGCPWSRREKPYRLPASLRRLDLSEMGVTSPQRARYSFHVASACALQELSLQLAQTFPAGLLELQQLKILNVETTFKTPPLPALGQLPLLEELTLKVQSDLGTGAFGMAGAFPSLKKFLLICQSGMTEMLAFHGGSMPCIETLDIRMSDGQRFPASIAELRSLKSLGLWGESIEQDAGAIFREVHCFPLLEFLSIMDSPTSEGTARTSRRSKCNRNALPEHILEREKQGKLRVETFYERFS